MNPDTKSQTPLELLRQARVAYYDNGDDKACARFLWEATFTSVRQLATRMGHPCEDQAQAKEFARYLEREQAGKALYATASLGFGLYMLDHAEDGWYSQDPEFALPFSEFPLAIREVTEIVEAFIAETESVKA